jgi:isopentenyl phosphate kinase
MKYHIIKLGGSIITDPALEGCFNKKNTSRLARELFPYRRGCILIHGTGHIGKPPAIKYNYLESGILEKKNHLIALGIKDSIRQLNQKVVRELLVANIPAIPLDILHFSGESINIKKYVLLKNKLKQMVRNGLVPVFYGDILPQADGRFKVISSDFLTLLIAKIIEPENVIFLTNVNGVYVNNIDLNNQSGNEIIPYLTTESLNTLRTNENDHKDVSGGMRNKVETALKISKYCNTCFIGSGYTRHFIRDFFNKVPISGTIVKAID